MLFPEAMMHDNVWFERPKYEEARHEYQMFLTNNLTLQVSKPHEEQGLFERATTAVAQVAQSASSAASSASSALINEISEIRDTIKQSLSGMVSQTSDISGNKDLKQLIEALAAQVASLDIRVSKLEGKDVPEQVAKKTVDEDDDDDIDLFGSDSDSETEEEKAAAEKKKAELIAKYNEKKGKKPALIPKSSILLDVKPWDDETDMKEMERLVRTIERDGLVWGSAKLIPVGYGIKKLQICVVVEDDKVGTDLLEEEITKFEDYVQSVDVAAFNKI